MKILIIDDNLKHRRAGVQQLQALGHEVVALSDYTAARMKAQEERFDAALIDLLMPAEPEILGSAAIVKYVGVEIPVGFPLALALAAAGIKLVAVATDTGHHDHPASAMVDWFGRWQPMDVNGARVIIIHAPMIGAVKDWAEVLRQLTE
ncbi:MAG: hypothetical protein HY461_03045 [Parcubacteria group bacterium]|nr:hypothetical protein [Parcubacteria group bacterium]